MRRFWPSIARPLSTVHTAAAAPLRRGAARLPLLARGPGATSPPRQFLPWAPLARLSRPPPPRWALVATRSFATQPPDDRAQHSGAQTPQTPPLRPRDAESEPQGAAGSPAGNAPRENSAGAAPAEADVTKSEKAPRLRLSNSALRRLAALQYREEMLQKSHTVLGRMAVRFKWLMIRRQRKFNTDDLSALFSWIIWGHILWIVLGTTTFISLLIWGLSKLRAQDLFAKWVSTRVTKETGMRVIFEEAMVPDWKQGVIVLRKVFVSRRPGATAKKVEIGSQADAADAAAAEAARHEGGAAGAAGAAAGEAKDAEQERAATEAANNNYTQFDLTMDSVAVTLSVSRWLAGKGILRTVEIKGLRGVVDRRHVVFDPDYDATQHKVKARRGDFNFELFKMDDVMVNVLQPGVPRPFRLSIYSCELPRLRRHWLLYDFMNATNMSGSYDGSLFTLNPRQLPVSDADREGMRRIQRLRVDDLDVRHLNRNDKGMFGWIESGTVDFLADIMLPTPQDDMSFRDKVKDVLERWEALLTSGRAKGSELETAVERAAKEREAHKLVLVDLRVQFNHTRASAPLYTRDLSYVSNALIHPVLAYINSRDTFIPVHCRVVKRLVDFEGSWTVYDSRLMDDVSAELYTACVRDIADEESRRRRIRKVGFWSLQFLAQLVLLTLGIVA